MKKLLSLLTILTVVSAMLLMSRDSIAQTEEPPQTELSTPGPDTQEPVFVEPPPAITDEEPPADFDAVPEGTPALDARSSAPATAGTPSGRIKIAPATKPSPSPQAAKSKSKKRAPKEVSRDEQRIESFDFQNAEIEEVVRAISQLTGRNFIIDPQVKGRISIVAPSAVTVGEAYRAFLSALAINGYSVVPTGKFLKIMPARLAQRDSIGVYINKTLPNSDQMVTRIVTLKHLNVTDVLRFMRQLVSKDGDMIGYEPTNALIISDYAANIRRLLTILGGLDQPGFEEKMSVIPVKYARAKDLADLITKIIEKGGGSTGGPGAPGTQFRSRFQRGPAAVGASGPGSEALSLVAPDERTNSLIVVGNQEGIDKVKLLVEELDFNLDPAESGGVFVYRLKHSVAETVANTLTGLVSKAAQGAAAGGPSQAPSASRPFTPPGATSIFGGDVKITPDKTTNSLIIVASKQDYDVVRGLLSKIDVPRDQVYVEAIIMEVNTDKTRDWNIANYYLDPGSQGVARAGFSGGNLSNFLSPINDAGLVLGFGRGERFTIKFGDTSFEIPSLLSFVNFLQRHTDANILSTPQILAMDNEEAKIEVGDQVPIGVKQTITAAGTAVNSPEYDQASIKLTITPHISPESDTIRLKVEQSVRQASEASSRVGAALRDISTIISNRAISTNISVENNDTVVLGGLIRDEESHTVTKIPLLGDIPVIGWLFKSDRVQNRKINLMVFLTPKIVRSQSDSRALLSRKIEDRVHWLEQNYIDGDPHGGMIDSLRRPLIPQPAAQDPNMQAKPEKILDEVIPAPPPRAPASEEPEAAPPTQEQPQGQIQGELQGEAGNEPGAAPEAGPGAIVLPENAAPSEVQGELQPVMPSELQPEGTQERAPASAPPSAPTPAPTPGPTPAPEESVPSVGG